MLFRSPGSGIGVGLKDTPKLPVRIIGSGFQCGSNLCGMMSVIVDDGHSVPFTFILETAVCTVEYRKSRGSSLKGDAKLQRSSQCGQRVGYIVDSGNT